MKDEAQYTAQGRSEPSDTVIVHCVELASGEGREGEQLIVITSLQLIQGCGTAVRRAANRRQLQHEISLLFPRISLY